MQSGTVDGQLSVAIQVCQFQQLVEFIIFVEFFPIFLLEQFVLEFNRQFQQFVEPEFELLHELNQQFVESNLE